MKRNCLLLFGIALGSQLLSAQEIIPFPDLSEQYQLHKNGGKSLDETNYAIFTEDYQKALSALDEQTDRILALRKEEIDQEKIDAYNEEIEAIRKKKLALLSEAELVEDLQKFY
jgi:hypothetical protein